jgi:FixJ family two-component response regulator
MEEPSVPLVCVLDDDASVRRALERLIRSVGLEVRSYSSVSEFQDHSPAHRPSCLVVDVRMPGPSGLDLQESLCDADSCPPIVFITGHGSVPMSVRAMRAGAVNFLEKPFDDEVILDSIRQAIERETRAWHERTWRLEIAEHFQALTPREREVFALVVVGLPNKRIAGRLGASEKTVKVHRARVMAKMQADSLADLVRMAHEAGLTPPSPEQDDGLSAPPAAALSSGSVGPKSDGWLLGASQVFTDEAPGDRFGAGAASPRTTRDDRSVPYRSRRVAAGRATRD